jgi:hypothetical protein
LVRWMSLAATPGIPALATRSARPIVVPRRQRSSSLAAVVGRRATLLLLCPRCREALAMSQKLVTLTPNKLTNLFGAPDARSCHLCFGRHPEQQQGRRNPGQNHGWHRCGDLVRRLHTRLVRSRATFEPVSCRRARPEHPLCSRHGVGALDFPCSDAGYSGSGDATCTADSGASTSQFVFSGCTGG